MTQTSATDPNNGLVKIVFSSPDGEVESMWAEPVGADTYKVRNTPWHIYGVNFEDVVRAHPASDGVLEFVEVVAPSGFSTFRIMRREGVGKPRFVEAFAPLKAMGCGYEPAFTRLYAIDVPPGADLGQVTAALDRGSADGVWDWEVGSGDIGGRPRRVLDRDDRPDDHTLRHRRRELNSTWVRMTLRLEQDEDGYPPYLFESIWVVRQQDGAFEVASIPFFSYDVALGDVVQAAEEPDDDGLFFKELVRESGNSVIRVRVADEQEREQLAGQLGAMGCETESLGSLLAVSIPAQILYGPILQVLMQGQESDRWGFEEAVLCHELAPGEIDPRPPR
jgi:hypothetical protein